MHGPLLDALLYVRVARHVDAVVPKVRPVQEHGPPVSSVGVREWAGIETFVRLLLSQPQSDKPACSLTKCAGLLPSSAQQLPSAAPHASFKTHLCSRTTRSRSSAAPSSCPKLCRQAACHRAGADAILCHWEQTHAATPRSAGGSLLMMMSSISSGSRRSMSPACSCKRCNEWVKGQYACARRRASPAGRRARCQAAVRNAPSHFRTDSVWRARGTGGLSRTP